MLIECTPHLWSTAVDSGGGNREHTVSNGVDRWRYLRCVPTMMRFQPGVEDELATMPTTDHEAEATSQAEADHQQAAAARASDDPPLAITLPTKQSTPESMNSMCVVARWNDVPFGSNEKNS